MNDIAMRRNADGPSKYAREVERAATRYICERSDLDGFVQVSVHIVSKPLKHILSQRAANTPLAFRGVPGNQAVNKCGRNVIPEKRSVWVTVCAFRHQATGKIEKRFIVACQSFDQLRLKRRVLCSRQSEPTCVDGDKKRISIVFAICGAVDSGRTNCKRFCSYNLRKFSCRSAAFNTHVRQLKPDQMLPRRRRKMYAIFETQTQDRHAALPLRAAGSQNCRYAAMVLNQIDFLRSYDHGFFS